MQLLPLKLITKLMGFMAEINLPKFLILPFLNYYCRKFNVVKDDMLWPLESYKNFNDFFTRQLKAGVRNFDKTEGAIISPVDGVVSEMGKIEDGKLLQVKGWHYSLDDLITKKQSLKFKDGSYMTIYLGPGDYHRIHSPTEGEVSAVLQMHGKFFPVNDKSRSSIKNLFCKNERILTMLETSKATIGVLKIAALIVGNIHLEYLEVQQLISLKKQLGKNYLYEMPKKVRLLAGQYMAHFNLGSTVILLFPKDKVVLENLANKKILLGQKIAKWN